MKKPPKSGDQGLGDQGSGKNHHARKMPGNQDKSYLGVGADGIRPLLLHYSIAGKRLLSPYCNPISIFWQGSA
jgi:hypothetical protein